MLPDVIDEFMIKTGERNESIFYSFYVFFNKLSAGVAVALSTLVLEYKKENALFLESLMS
jgi:Na+/melibiose symporter-like transporter